MCESESVSFHNSAQNRFLTVADKRLELWKPPPTDR